jgi:hypothetical protein
MRATKDDLTAKRLREVIDYKPETGEFIWRYPINQGIHAGQQAGYVSQGYRRIGIDGSTYLAHRLAWLYMTGEWPKEQVDHADGNRGNNAWRNLREATHAENHFNIGIISTNKSGFKGVSWFRKTRKWRARITANGKERTIGYFDTKELAHEAYRKAASELHGQFANFGTK